MVKKLVISMDELASWFCEYLGCDKDSMAGDTVKEFLMKKLKEERI